MQFTSDVEKKLNDLAAQTGRGANEVLHDALAGYFEELVPGDEVEARFREKSTSARR